MKKVVLIVVLVLICVFSITQALASPEDYKDKVLDDFAVNTINGKVFSLSQALKTHELVLINFWATWCGPCRMEFPYLETAWQQYSERVDVIALSVESEDTTDVLNSFAKENNLHFSIGRDEGHIFDRMDGTAIPTTLIVNKDRCVVAVEIGSQSSVKDFTDLFDSLLSKQPTQNSTANRCVLFFRDTNGNPIQGVSVGFCNGEYDPVESDINGRVTFDGNPNDYHVHLLSVPSGYSKTWEILHIEGEQYEITVTLYSE